MVLIKCREHKTPIKDILKGQPVAQNKWLRKRVTRLNWHPSKTFPLMNIFPVIWTSLFVDLNFPNIKFVSTYNINLTVFTNDKDFGKRIPLMGVHISIYFI